MKDKKLSESFSTSLEIVCNSKGIKYEGFHVQDEQNYASISEDTMEAIFSKVIEATQKSSMGLSNNKSLYGND